MKKQTDTAKRILLVLPRPTFGGASQVLLNILNEDVQRKGFRYFIIFNDTTEYKAAFINLVENIFFSPLDRPSRIRNGLIKLSRRGYNLCKSVYFKWVCFQVKPDIIYINTVVETPHAWQALKMNIPVIVHAHEMDIKMRDAWIQKLVQKSSTWIVCSNAVGEYFRIVYGLPTEKTNVLHSPPSLSRIATTRQGYYRTLLNCPSDCIMVGAAGTLSYLKGADTFVKAVKLIKNKYKRRVVYAWVGLDAQVKNSTFHISLTNLIKQYDLEDDLFILPVTNSMGDFYIDIDLLVAPSRNEAMGLTILEAMLYNKAVVAMDVGGIGESVDETTGYLVKDRTPEGLAEGILYFLESEERRQLAGKAGRQCVLEKFEAKVQAPKWLNLLESI